MTIRGFHFRYLVVTEVHTTWCPVKAELFRTEDEAVRAAKFAVQQANISNVEVWFVNDSTSRFDYTLLWTTKKPRARLVRPRAEDRR